MTDVLIDELFRKIPPAGAVWPAPDRYRWLRAIESVLDLLYGDNRVIEIGPLPERKTVDIEEKAEPKAETKAAPAPSSQTPSDHKPSLPEQNERARELMTDRAPTSPAPKGRPANIPTNLNMALDAIEELGGSASARQILSWCRERYWADMPTTWTANLWNYVSDGKLARDGLNFKKPPAKAAPSLPAPAPVVAPAAPPVVRSPPPTAAEGAMPFEFNGRKVMLHKKEWRLATALVRAMGKGHLDYRFLVDAATAGEKRPPVGDKTWLAEMFDVLKPKLLPVGLDVIHSPPYGYSVHEVEPANG